MTFIALCGDTSPHFTTIANFVSTLGDNIVHVFTAVLAICDRQGLIGREMFAIDGVKLLNNASKSRSGTRADFEYQAAKLETAAKTMLQRHREQGAKHVEPDLVAKEVKCNEAPRSKLRGIIELIHSELPEIFLRLPLPLHIPFDGLPVCPFPYRGHIVPIAPKLPAPQYPLHRRLSAKNLPRRDALEYLHNPA